MLPSLPSALSCVASGYYGVRQAASPVTSMEGPCEVAYLLQLRFSSVLYKDIHCQVHALYFSQMFGLSYYAGLKMDKCG